METYHLLLRGAHPTTTIALFSVWCHTFTDLLVPGASRGCPRLGREDEQEATHRSPTRMCVLGVPFFWFLVLLDLACVSATERDSSSSSHTRDRIGPHTRTHHMGPGRPSLLRPWCSRTHAVLCCAAAGLLLLPSEGGRREERRERLRGVCAALLMSDPIRGAPEAINPQMPDGAAAIHHRQRGGDRPPGCGPHGGCCPFLAHTVSHHHIPFSLSLLLLSSAPRHHHPVGL